MASQKRDRDAEPVSNLIASYISSVPTKRAKTDKADVADKIFARADKVIGYSHLLIFWSRPMTEQQKQFLVETTKGMMKLKSAEEFKKPHTTEQMSRALMKIKKPMDLSTMIKLLETGGYSSVTDLCVDFKSMITNAQLINPDDRELSAAAGRLFTSFNSRMNGCPTGLDGTPASEYRERTMDLLKSLIPDFATRITTPQPDKPEVIYIDSDTEELEASSRPASTLKPNKIPQPDDLDDEIEKLQKEIEERQERLVHMAERKKVLAEIRSLDIEKAELVGKISDTEEQYAQLNADVRTCDAKSLTHSLGYTELQQQQVWHREGSEKLDRESKRIGEEIEKYRKAKGIIDRRVTMFIAKRDRLDSEHIETKEKRDQIGNEDAQLSERLDQLENQRAIAKKKLDDLDHGSI
jgi:hypothetical protein